MGNSMVVRTKAVGKVSLESEMDWESFELLKGSKAKIDLRLLPSE